MIETLLVIAVCFPAGIYAQKHPAFGMWWFGVWAVASVVISAISAAERDWGWAAFLAAAAVINAWSWWDCRRRKRRKRAPRAYGAKSRALIAAIVAKARAAAKPRPVLRPIPAGAR
jgi:hypothetical protein